VGTIAFSWRYHGRMMGCHFVVVVTSEAYYTELHFARKFCWANDEHFGLPAW
jgi:hypothetical protein